MRQATFISLSVALLGSLAMGVRADEKVDVYSGNPGAVTIATWGAGVMEADEEETYLDSPALRVETKGFYEGGRLILAKPLAADTFLAKPENGYISLVVKAHEPEVTEVPMGGVGDFGVIPGGDFPMAPGMDPAMMDPGMMAPPPGGGPGFPGEEPPMDPGMWSPTRASWTRAQSQSRITRRPRRTGTRLRCRWLISAAALTSRARP